MTEEEKKAIEKIKYYNNFRVVDLSLYYLDMQIATEMVLNLIETQQAEIKQLKEDMSNMYDEKVVRNILEDECGLSKYEIDEILN